MEYPFYGLEFYAPTDAVLRPYAETGLLVDAALCYLKGRSEPTSVCDLGTGCGSILISILLNAIGPIKAVATDISANALAVARRNAETYGVDVEFIETDMASGLSDESFDLVTCNPPYCPAEETTRIEAFESSIGPRLSYDGGDDGLDMMRRMLREVPRIIKPNGVLITELNDGHAEAVHEYALATKQWRCIEIFNDQLNIPRCMRLRKF